MSPKNYSIMPVEHLENVIEELYNTSHISTKSVIGSYFGNWKKKFSTLRCAIHCKIPLALKSKNIQDIEYRSR